MADQSLVGYTDTSTTTVTLLSANQSRRGILIQNMSSAVMYVKFGEDAGAAKGEFSFALSHNAIYEAPDGSACWRGPITAVWASDDSSYAAVTEIA